MTPGPTDDPITMEQRRANAAKLQSIDRHPGDGWHIHGRPLFSCKCPRWKEPGQICRLHCQRDIMSLPHVINTVLSGSLPHHAPHNRTMPQLHEFHVARRQCACPNPAEYIFHNVYSSPNAITRNVLCTPSVNVPDLAGI